MDKFYLCDLLGGALRDFLGASAGGADPESGQKQCRLLQLEILDERSAEPLDNFSRFWTKITNQNMVTK